MKPISREPSSAASCGRHAGFHVAHHVFQHHDGVVHHESGGDGQRHQGQIVERIAQQVHDPEGADDGEGHGNTGDEGGADFAQEDEHHQDDEYQRDDQGAFDVGDRSPNGRGAIQRDVELDALRHRRLQERQLLDDPVNRRNDVGAGLPENDDHDAGLAVEAAGDVGVGVGILNVGDVAEADRSAIPVGNDDRPIILGLLELVVGANHPGFVAALQRALRLVHVLRRNRRADRVQANVHFVEQVGIRFDTHRGLRRSADIHLAYTLDLRQLLGEDRVRRIVHLVLRHGVGRQRQDQDGGVGGVHLAIAGIAGQIRGQESAGRVDGRLHIARRRIDVAVQVELHGDARRSQLAGRRHLVDAGDAAELPLQRSRHRSRHGLRTGARQSGAY